MGLSDIVAAKAKEPSPEKTLKDVQADIEARVRECVAEGRDHYVEIPVPFSMFVELQAWVEGEGMVCGSHQQAGKVVSLIVFPYRKPAVPDEVT